MLGVGQHSRAVSFEGVSPVVDDGEEAKGEADAESHGDGVLGIGRHALEDLARADDGRHDHGQTGPRQHNVSGATGGISSTCTQQ